MDDIKRRARMGGSSGGSSGGRGSGWLALLLRRARGAASGADAEERVFQRWVILQVCGWAPALRLLGRGRGVLQPPCALAGCCREACRGMHASRWRPTGHAGPHHLLVPAAHHPSSLQPLRPGPLLHSRPLPPATRSPHHPTQSAGIDLLSWVLALLMCVVTLNRAAAFAAGCPSAAAAHALAAAISSSPTAAAATAATTAAAGWGGAAAAAAECPAGCGPRFAADSAMVAGFPCGASDVRQFLYTLRCEGGGYIHYEVKA